LDAVAEQAQRLLALADSPQAIQAGVSDEDLRATALIDLGAAEMWSGQLDAADRHLGQALEEARRIGRRMLELQALADSAILGSVQSTAIGEQRAREAIELARAHGWEETAPFAASAYVALGTVALWRARLAEAEGWLDRAELVLPRFAEPTTAMMLYGAGAILEFARGRHEAAMTAQRAAESIQRGFATRHILASPAQARTLEVLVHIGETELVQRTLDDMDENVRATSAMRVVLATLRLARDDPEGAAPAPAPIFAGALPNDNPYWEIQALLLKARVDDALGDIGASSRALERALDLAEPTASCFPSCCTRRRRCSSASRDSAPPTPRSPCSRQVSRTFWAGT
jgi:LuxR family maltose regulon positive regulatory protein